MPLYPDHRGALWPAGRPALSPGAPAAPGIAGHGRHFAPAPPLAQVFGPEPGSRPLFPAVVRLLGAGAAPFFPANGHGGPDPAYPDGHGPDAGIGALAALAFWRHLRKMGLWLAAGKRRRGPSRLLGEPGPHLLCAAKGPLLPNPNRMPLFSVQKLQAV